jgi:hypothetical protein
MMPDYLVRVQVNRLEKWIVAAANETEAAELWEDGECQDVDADDSDVLSVTCLGPTEEEGEKGDDTDAC